MIAPRPISARAAFRFGGLAMLMLLCFRAVDAAPGPHQEPPGIESAVESLGTNFEPVEETDRSREGVLSLREAVDRSLRNNRQLQIERINPEVARFTLQSSYGYYDPLLQSRVHSETATDTGGFDPANFSADAVFSAESEVVTLGLLGYLPSGLTYTIGGNYAHSSGSRNFLNFDSYKLGTGIYLEQPLLKNFWIDAPRWMIQVNKKNLKISELGVSFVAMTVINLVQQGYCDLQFAWESLRVQEGLIAARTKFLDGIRRQIALGTMTMLEEKTAQAQLAAAQTELVSSSNLVALASNNLKIVMGVAATNWNAEFFVPDRFLTLFASPLDLQESWRLGLAQRPDLQQLAVNLESAELTLKFRRNQLLPTVNLFGSYSLRGSDAIQAFPPDSPRADLGNAFREIGQQSAPNSTIGVLFSIPVTRTVDRANHRASQELKKQAELLLKQKEELILREIADAADLARYSQARVDSAKQATQFAGEAVRAEEQKLQGGAGSVIFVLQAQTELARVRIAELTALRDHQKALSQLHFAEGSLLERNRIVFKFR